MVTLGKDEWAQESNKALRIGLRTRNRADFGDLQVWVVGNSVILTDGGFCEHPIECKSASLAIGEWKRIVGGLDRGFRLVDLLPNEDLPEKIVSAWVN